MGYADANPPYNIPLISNQILPVVTAVIREENAALGRNLDNPLVNPSGFRIIGDRGLYERLLGRELTDTSSPDQPLVWRLLIDRDGYFYIFPSSYSCTKIDFISSNNF